MKLGRGFAVKTARVQHETRIELTGEVGSWIQHIEAAGCITEIIDWKMRAFIPNDEQAGPAAIESLIAAFGSKRPAVTQPAQSSRQGDEYPEAINTEGLKALYDVLGGDDALALEIHEVVLTTKKADWHGNLFKEREIQGAIATALRQREQRLLEHDPRRVFAVVKEQGEYR
jgi:hypothetical protein